MDLVVRTPRFVTPGETLTARSWSAVPGGKGANQAVAAARLGAKTSFCGRIGNDDFGAALRAGLIREGIDEANLGVVDDGGTGIAMIAVEESGRNAIYVVGGANHSVSSNIIQDFAHVVGRAQVLLLQLETPIGATLSAIALANKLGVSVLLDPAPAPVGQCPDALLKVDLISPNESEAEALTGIRPTDLAQAKRSAIELAKRDAKQVVIKLGERGALALDQFGGAWHVSAAPVKVVDTTAAGDAFSAALAIALAEGKDLVAATQFACAAGAVAVGREGAQPSMPTRSEVDEMLEAYEFRTRPL